jgi:hypothetical protein
MSISLEYAWLLFLQQGRHCAVTGLPLTMTRDGHKQTASLDRIDSEKGYVEGNVRWVHTRINLMRLDMTDAEFIRWCKLVAEQN